MAVPARGRKRGVAVSGKGMQLIKETSELDFVQSPVEDASLYAPYLDPVD